MKQLQMLLFDDFVRGLGWTLLHSLWQILAIATVIALLLANLQRAKASVRYAVACVAMMAMFLVVPCTLAYVLALGTPIPALPPIDATFDFEAASPWSDLPAATVEKGLVSAHEHS